MVPFFDNAPLYGRGGNDKSGTRQQRQRTSPYWSPESQLAHLDDRMFDMGNDLADFRSALTRLGFDSEFGRRPNVNWSWLDILSPSVESHAEGGTVENPNQPGKYTMNVPLCDSIAPEDLKVSLKDHVMTIEAKKETKSKDGNSRVYQEFMKKFTLPPNVDMKEVKSVLTPEGYLKIEAPLPIQALSEPEPPQKKQALEIPIHQG